MADSTTLTDGKIPLPTTGSTAEGVRSMLGITMAEWVRLPLKDRMDLYQNLIAQERALEAQW